MRKGCNPTQPSVENVSCISKVCVYVYMYIYIKGDRQCLVVIGKFEWGVWGLKVVGWWVAYFFHYQQIFIFIFTFILFYSFYFSFHITFLFPNGK